MNIYWLLGRKRIIKVHFYKCFKVISLSCFVQILFIYKCHIGNLYVWFLIYEVTTSVRPRRVDKSFIIRRLKVLTSRLQTCNFYDSVCGSEKIDQKDSITSSSYRVLCCFLFNHLCVNKCSAFEVFLVVLTNFNDLKFYPY